MYDMYTRYMCGHVATSDGWTAKFHGNQSVSSSARLNSSLPLPLPLPPPGAAAATPLSLPYVWLL